MQRTIFVTGGAGFIGSGFVRYLLATQPDAHVVVFDKLTYAGNLENLTAVSDDARFRFVRGDICDAAAVREAMRGCDAVVNFAAETHVDRSIEDPSAFVKTDVEGTYTLLEGPHGGHLTLHPDQHRRGLRQRRGARWHQPSLARNRRAQTPLALRRQQGWGRPAGLLLLGDLWLPVIVTRCSNNYGPYQYPEKQLPLFITNTLASRPLPVYGDGRNTRDWIHVDDHCSALIAILDAPAEKVVGEVFNVGADEERNILQKRAPCWRRWASRRARSLSCRIASAMCVATPSILASCGRTLAGRRASRSRRHRPSHRVVSRQYLLD